jgi:hypothetical protein
MPCIHVNMFLTRQQFMAYTWALGLLVRSARYFVAQPSYGHKNWHHNFLLDGWHLHPWEQCGAARHAQSSLSFITHRHFMGYKWALGLLVRSARYLTLLQCCTGVQRQPRRLRRQLMA